MSPVGCWWECGHADLVKSLLTFFPTCSPPFRAVAWQMEPILTCWLAVAWLGGSEAVGLLSMRPSVSLSSCLSKSLLNSVTSYNH